MSEQRLGSTFVSRLLRRGNVGKCYIRQLVHAPECLVKRLQSARKSSVGRRDHLVPRLRGSERRNNEKAITLPCPSSVRRKARFKIDLSWILKASSDLSHYYGRLTPPVPHAACSACQAVLLCGRVPQPRQHVCPRCNCARFVSPVSCVQFNSAFPVVRIQCRSCAGSHCTWECDARRACAVALAGTLTARTELALGPRA
jgi:hypothetical protein